MAGDRDRLRAMGDIMDMQLESRDGRRIGRVADIEAELRDDGALVLTHLVVGPEALSGRVASRLRPLAHRLLLGRFEHRIPVADIEDVGLAVRLRGAAKDYAVGRSDRWLADHIVRFIPGSG